MPDKTPKPGDPAPAPKNKPLGPVPKAGFGLNAAQPTPAETPHSVPPPPGLPIPYPTAAPTPQPAAQGATPSPANFNIMDLLRESGVLPQTPDRAAQESVAGYRATHGPTLSPPYTDEMPGYGVRQFTPDQQYPYYVKPEKGVQPQPATSYGTPY